MQWIEHLRDEGKRIALVDGGARGEAALALAGLDEHFELSAPTIEAEIEGLGLPPDRIVVVAAPAEGVAAGGQAAAYLVIAVARGLATPEQLRRRRHGRRRGRTALAGRLGRARGGGEAVEPAPQLAVVRPAEAEPEAAAVLLEPVAGADVGAVLGSSAS